MSDTLSIGVVAARTGLAVSAVRYYDEIGVIETAERVGGKRRFDGSTVGRVNFIRRSQDAGFSLEEIRAMLDERSSEVQRVRDRCTMGGVVGLIVTIKEQVEARHVIGHRAVRGRDDAR